MLRDEGIDAESSRLPHTERAEYVAVVSVLDEPGHGATLRGRLRIFPDGRWALDLDKCATLTGALTPDCPMGALLARLRAA